MTEPIDLGAELAGYTDADHTPPRRPDTEPDPYYWDYVQGLKIAAPLAPRTAPGFDFEPAVYTDQISNVTISRPGGPLPSFVITDPPHPNQMQIPADLGAPPPPLADRCAQCRRYIPPIKGPNGLVPRRWALYCDECEWMRGGP